HDEAVAADVELELDTASEGRILLQLLLVAVTDLVHVPPHHALDLVSRERAVHDGGPLAQSRRAASPASPEVEAAATARGGPPRGAGHAETRGAPAAADAVPRRPDAAVAERAGSVVLHAVGEALAH